MEMIIGCIFLTVLLLILLIFCKNITLTINITYPEPKLVQVDDLYNGEGEPKEHEQKQTIDDVLKAVNSIMLDTEDEV